MFNTFELLILSTLKNGTAVQYLSAIIWLYTFEKSVNVTNLDMNLLGVIHCMENIFKEKRFCKGDEEQNCHDYRIVAK